MIVPRRFEPEVEQPEVEVRDTDPVAPRTQGASTSPPCYCPSFVPTVAVFFSKFHVESFALEIRPAQEWPEHHPFAVGCATLFH